MRKIRWCLIQVLKWSGRVLVGAVIMAPISETVVGFGKVNHYNSVLVVAAGFAVSMLQLLGEYWGVGKTSDGVKVWFRQWWSGTRIKPLWDDLKTMVLDDTKPVMQKFRPWIEGGGYVTMCVSCLNPLTIVPPFGRVTAVTIWRNAKLPGSPFIIIALSFVKLLLFLAGVSIFVR